MPIRLRITILFAALVFVILSAVCGSIYYFSYTSRINTIKTRLLNRAITTARLLSQSEMFTREQIQRIDSSTTLAIKNKVVHAYDYQNNRIYQYSDLLHDTITVGADILDDARVQGNIFFTTGAKEAVAYHYTAPDRRIVLIVAGEDMEGRANLSGLRDILVLSFLGGIIIALASGFFFSTGLVRPLGKIANEVREISAHNLARRIEGGKSKDEWHQLAATLNELMNRLQQSFELQRRFISNASHELSTPLTSISSQLEVTLQRERSSEDYRRVMKSVLQDVMNMSRLTQALLEFAKASGDPGGLELHGVRVDEVLMRLPAEMQKLDPSSGVVLQFEGMPDDEDQLLVYGNEELLFTAFKNIVSNACKYSPDHRAVVTFATGEEGFVITVRDKGMGISEEEIDRIYEPFYRSDESRTTSGFGLGLSLAERIIRLHKGSIEVQSTKGAGTSFTIRLPKAG